MNSATCKIRVWMAAALLAAQSVSASPAVAVDPPAAAPEAFTPAPPPASAEFDWVQLVSGEWLKGQIKTLGSNELQFDSDKLNLLKIDWKDIAEIRSARPMAVLFGDDSTAVGTLRTESGKLVIAGATETRVPLRDVLTISVGTPREIDRWFGNVSVGANVRSGNTQQVDFSTTVNIQRRTPKTRLGLSYTGKLLRG